MTTGAVESPGSASQRVTWAQQRPPQEQTQHREVPGLTMEDYKIADKIVDPPRTFAYSFAVAQLATITSIEDVLGAQAQAQDETPSHASDAHNSLSRRVAAPPQSRPVTLLDLGTCDARTTVPFFRACVNRLRRRPGWPRSQSVQVIFEDHRHNDWAPVTSRNLKAELNDEHVYPFLSTTSFFEAVAPPNTVDLAFTNCAFHYLSKPPSSSSATHHHHHKNATCYFQKAIRHVSAEKTTRDNKAALAAFRSAAKRDWETLLLRRARELRRGGVLVISNFAWDEDRDFHWGKTDTGASLYDELASCVQDLVDSGALTADEQRKMTTPAYYRTLKEHVAPFDDPSSPVRRAGLSLRSAAINITRCPFRRDLLDRCTGPFCDEDLDAYAERFTRCFRSVTAWEIARAFRDDDDDDDDGDDSPAAAAAAAAPTGGSGHQAAASPENVASAAAAAAASSSSSSSSSTRAPRRSPDERKRIVDEVYRSFAERVKQRPLDFSFDSVMAILVIEKVASS